MLLRRRFAGEMQAIHRDDRRCGRDHGTASFQPHPLEETMNAPTFLRGQRSTSMRALFVAGALALSATIASAASEDDVRAVFDQFVNAQNAHDVPGVRELLLDSPNFLWVTRGMPVWGREAALKRFESLYQGTWKLSPDQSNLKTVLVSETTAQLYVPITFNIGAPGQPAPDTPFLMNQTLVKTAAGWRIANILPIPLPAPSTAQPK
jgi:ketosteroid isomerase-like protein